MLLTITTGIKFARLPGRGFTATSFAIEMPDQEINPDDVFHAGNRIDTDENDLANLRHDWQKVVRRVLDEAEASSISVGDIIEIYGGNAETARWLGGWLCESVGWSKLTEASGAPVIIFDTIEEAE